MPPGPPPMTATFLPVEVAGTGRAPRPPCSTAKRLSAADVDRVVHHGAAAANFAGVFANQGAHRGQRIVLANQAHGVAIASFGDQGDIAGDIHAGRALRHAGHGLVEFQGAAAIAQNCSSKSSRNPSTPLQDHLRRFIADGAVGRIRRYCGRSSQSNRWFPTAFAVEHVVHQRL